MSRTLYLFAEPKVLGELFSAGLCLSQPEDRDPAPGDADKAPPPGEAIGFDRDKAGRLHGHVDYLSEGFGFDPWKQPDSARDRPLRVHVELLADPAKLPMALGWWPRLIEARERGGLQADAESVVDATILVLGFEPNPQQRSAIAAASESRAIYLIGPVHRTTPDRRPKQAIHTWPVEVARLATALQVSPARTRPGLHAWSSIEFVLGSHDGTDFTGSRKSLGATIGRLLRPAGETWIPTKATSTEEVLSVKPTFSPMPSAFEDWPVTSGEPGFIADRVRLDSRSWSVARESAGRKHRMDRDDREVAKVVGGFGSDDGEAAQAFASVRGKDGLSKLRGIAGSTIRAGQSQAVTNDIRSLESGWAELLARVREARSHEHELGGCAEDLSEARSHLPAFLWRLFVVGAVATFVGGLVAFSLGRLGGLLGSAAWWIPGVCIAAALGSLVGAFGVWWGEMRSGERGLEDLKRKAEQQKDRIQRAYDSAGSLVAGGASWWKDWRFHGNARSIRLVAKRLESIIAEVAREESDEGAFGALDRETIAHKRETTQRLVGSVHNPDVSYLAGQITDLGEYPSLKGAASRTGAVMTRELSADLRSRLRGYRKSVLGDSRVSWEPDGAKFRNELEEAKTRLSGKDARDSPGLSVITLPNDGNPVDPVSIAAVVKPLGDAVAKFVQDAEFFPGSGAGELPPTLATDGIVVRIIRIHLGEDRNGWSEGEPRTDAGGPP